MKVPFLRRWFGRSMATVRYEGVVVLLWRILQKFVSPLGRLEIVSYCRKDLTRPLKEFRAKVDISFDRATESDIDQITRLLEELYGNNKTFSEHDRAVFLQRFRDGYDCFVAKNGPEIINYNWIFYDKKIDVDYYLIYLKDDEAFTDDAFTTEKWRGNGIHTAGLYQMLLFLQQSGYKRAITCVATDNKSSRKTHHRLGWELFGTMIYFVPRGRKTAWKWRLSGNLELLKEDQGSGS